MRYRFAELDFELDKQIIDCFKMDYLSHLKEEYIKDMFFKIISFDSKKGLDYIIKYNVFKHYPFYQAPP